MHESHQIWTLVFSRLRAKLLNMLTHNWRNQVERLAEQAAWLRCCFIVPSLLICALACGAGAGTASAAEQEVTVSAERRAFTDLVTYYRGGGPPPSDAAIAELSDPQRAEAASVYLCALLQQLRDDQVNGRAPWKSTGAWGGSWQNPAKDLLATLATAIGDRATGPAALPAARWLIDKDDHAEMAAHGMRVLMRCDDATVTADFHRLLAQPHPVQQVTVGVIQEIARRRLNGFAPELRRLAGHYRTAVRAQASAAAIVVQVGDLAAFQPATAATPWLTVQLDRINAMIEPVPTMQNSFGRLIVTWHQSDKDGDHPTTTSKFVWFIGENEEGFTVYDLFARQELCLKPVNEATRTQHADCARRPGTIAEAVESFASLRQRIAAGGAAGKAAAQQLSASGGLTSQFESGRVSLPELVLAMWCRQHGDIASAMLLLLPCLDGMSDDRWLVLNARDLLGTRYHQEMLQSFSDRNYARALVVARHLSQPCFDGYNYQERAKRLTADLPTRMEDFISFVLPTADQWRAQSATLTRSARITFLADHLRLLNCVQSSQPGGVSYSDPQFDKPAAMSMTRTGRLADSGPAHAVINPYVELEGLLTVADLPILLPYLRDERYLPTFSFWRDFKQGRTLHRVNWAVAELLNKTSHAELVDVRVFDSADLAGKDAILARLTQWCAAHADKSRSELVLKAIDTATTWPAVMVAAEEAVEYHETAAVPHLLARRKDFPAASAAGMDNVARVCCRLGGAQAVIAADEWLSGNERLRFWGEAIIVLHAGHDDPRHAQALADLQQLIAKDDGLEYLGEIVDDLIAARTPETMRLAISPLVKPTKTPWRLNGLMLRLLLAGDPVASAAVLAALESTSPSDDTRPGLHRVLGDDVALMACNWGPAPAYTADADDTVRATQRRDLAKWLHEQVDLIAAGKPSALVVPPRRMQGSSGWVLDTP